MVRPTSAGASGTRDAGLAFLAGGADVNGMWQRLLRRLVFMIVGVAFLGGATVQALPPSSLALSSAIDSAMPGCVDAAMMQDADGTVRHQGITPDCVKLMQCLGIPALPEQVRLGQARVHYAAVRYWTPDRMLGGLSPEPVPFPPRPA